MLFRSQQQSQQKHVATKPTHYWGIIKVPVTDTPLGVHQAFLVLTMLSGASLLIPPRTVRRGLFPGAVCVYGALQLRYDWSGQTFRQRTFGGGTGSNNLGGSDNKTTTSSWNELPEKAQLVRERLRLEKELRTRNFTSADERTAWLEKRLLELAHERDSAREHAKMNWFARNMYKDKEAFDRGETLWDVMKKDIDEVLEGIGINKHQKRNGNGDENQEKKS